MPYKKKKKGKKRFQPKLRFVDPTEMDCIRARIIFLTCFSFHSSMSIEIFTRNPMENPFTFHSVNNLTSKSRHH